jgi:hypothetical protein
VLDDAFADFKGQVQTGEVRVFLFKAFHDAEGVQVVVKPLAKFLHHVIERAFPDVAEGRMTDIVYQRQRLNQVLIQIQRLGHRAADLRHFQGVRQAIAKMIRRTAGEDLGLIFQAPEGPRVNNAVAVALVSIAIRMRRLGITPARGLLNRHGVGRQTGRLVSSRGVAEAAGWLAQTRNITQPLGRTAKRCAAESHCGWRRPRIRYRLSVSKHAAEVSVEVETQ